MFKNVSIEIASFEGDAIVNSLGAKDQLTVPGRIFDSILAASSNPEALMGDILRQGAELPYGSLFVTNSYGLPCKRILNVITPVRRRDRDYSQIKRCYEDILSLALKLGLTSICVPVIGTGANGYPSDEVATIARMACFRFANEHPEIDVFLDLYSLEHGKDLQNTSTGRTKTPEPKPDKTEWFFSESGCPVETSFLEEIGIGFEESFATLVRRFVFTRNEGTKEEKEAILEELWVVINSYVAGLKTDPKLLGDTISDTQERQELGERPSEFLDKGKSSHDPQYEWKKVKNTKGHGYVWQCPNKAEILLACLAMKLTPEETFEVYEFCGFSLSKFDRYDNAFRECVALVRDKNPWTCILQKYRFYTSESLYEYKEDRKKKYTDTGDRF